MLLQPLGCLQLCLPLRSTESLTGEKIRDPLHVENNRDHEGMNTVAQQSNGATASKAVPAFGFTKPALDLAPLTELFELRRRRFQTQPGFFMGSYFSGQYSCLQMAACLFNAAKAT